MSPSCSPARCPARIRLSRLGANDEDPEDRARLDDYKEGTGDYRTPRGGRQLGFAHRDDGDVHWPGCSYAKRTQPGLIVGD